MYSSKLLKTVISKQFRIRLRLNPSCVNIYYYCFQNTEFAPVENMVVEKLVT